MNCNICSEAKRYFSTAQVMKKYNVKYYLCENCGFIQTEEPYWLEESYSNEVNISDIGMVTRNLNLSRIAGVVISGLFNSNASFLDFGGGFALFTRLMRDRGFDYYHQDLHCNNIFAKGFEGNVDASKYFEVITALDVIEHLYNPVDEINRMLKCSDSVLFTTELLPMAVPEPEDWWYYSLENGQHVSLFSMQSLIKLANRLSLNLYSNKKSIHLLTRKKISPMVFSLLTNRMIVALYSFTVRRESLLPNDYMKLFNKDCSSR